MRRRGGAAPSLDWRGHVRCPGRGLVVGGGKVVGKTAAARGPDDLGAGARDATCSNEVGFRHDRGVKLLAGSTKEAAPSPTVARTQRKARGRATGRKGGDTQGVAKQATRGPQFHQKRNRKNLPSVPPTAVDQGEVAGKVGT